MFLMMLAECHAQAGDPDSALQRLADAEEMIESTGERFFEAELHRLHGEIKLAAGDEPSDTEKWFTRAIEVARAQNAHLLELRAATSLAGFLESQIRQIEAREVLTPTYRRFAHGFELTDLREAKAVLDAARK